MHPATFLKDIDAGVGQTLTAFREKLAAGPATDQPRMLGAEAKPAAENPTAPAPSAE
jgi:hypothetical protein